MSVTIRRLTGGSQVRNGSGGLTEVVGGSVGAENREPSSLGDGDGQEGRSETHATGLRGVRQLQAQLLGIVVDQLGAVHTQAVEAEA